MSTKNTLNRTPVAALLLAVGLAAPAGAGVYSWIGGNGVWQNPIMWFPNAVPNTGDDVLIGNMPGASNSTVTLIGETPYGSLTISNGMTLDTNFHELLSFGALDLQGAGTTLIARPSPGGNLHDVQGELYVDVGAIFQMEPGVNVRIFDEPINAGLIKGNGELIISSPDPFENYGVIRPFANGGITINQGSLGDGAIDLDGYWGDGLITMDLMFAELHVNAGNFLDAFSSDILMAPGAVLTMNVDAGWSVDGGFTVVGQGDPNNAAQLHGTELQMSGHFGVIGDQGNLRVACASTLEPQATATVEGDCVLEFEGPTTVLGGEYATESHLGGGGTILFSGPTTWEGASTFHGSMIVEGDATVSDLASISGDGVDLDGILGHNLWTIGSGLTVNVDEYFGNAANWHLGDITIAGGVFPKLTVNLNGWPESWSMLGVMNLSGATHLIETRIAGSHVNFHDELNVLSGKVRVAADCTFSGPGVSATVDIGPAESELHLSGQALVHDNTMFSGQGTLVTGASADLWLDDGASLDQTPLRSLGRLRVGFFDFPGAASVDQLECGINSIFDVSLSGYLQGDEHDLLIVSGGVAQLAGGIEVILQEGFAPLVGDSFTVISALGGVSGSFQNDPVTISGAHQYDWSVVYEPNAVVLVVDAVNPAPTCCPGNANRIAPGQVDFADITAVLGRWLDPGDGSDVGDANCDGIVNFADITEVLANWLNLCP